MLLRIFQYTAPILLALLVWTFAWLNKSLHVVADFSAIGILNIGIAPLAELYYLWQRPTHYRYPVMLSVSLLSFHAALGLDNYLLRAGLAESQVFGSISMGQWTDGAVAIWAGVILLVYFLRTYYKQPWRGVDGIKVGLVILIFGGFIMGIVGKGYLAELNGGTEIFNVWLSVSIMGGAILFVIIHLIDVLLLAPVMPEMTNYESLIEEIDAGAASQGANSKSE